MPARAQDFALQARLEAIAADAPGQLCVAVEDFATGAAAAVRGDERCPMHSVVKIFIAAHAAREIAQGRLADTQTLVLDHATAPNGHGRIDRRAAARGTVEVSLAQMLEAMLVDSDNISADGLLRVLGGPPVVRAALDLPAGIDMSQSLRDQLKPFGIAKTMATYDRFMADTRDTATPLAFVAALRRLAQGRLGGPVADRRVLVLMGQAWRGKARMPRGLGPAWTALGRTGSGQPVAGRTTAINNCLVAVHRGTKRVVLAAAFLKDARRGLGAQEACLASVGRAIRDAWPDG